jgi:hypothetical protein
MQFTILPITATTLLFATLASTAPYETDPKFRVEGRSEVQARSGFTIQLNVKSPGQELENFYDVPVQFRVDWDAPGPCPKPVLESVEIGGVWLRKNPNEYADVNDFQCQAYEDEEATKEVGNPFRGKDKMFFRKKGEGVPVKAFRCLHLMDFPFSWGLKGLIQKAGLAPRTARQHETLDWKPIDDE